MLGWAEFKHSLCPGCGEPKAEAWHPDNDGWYEVDAHSKATCHACTAMRRDGADTPGKVDPVEYVGVVLTRDYDTDPLPPMPVRPDPQEAPTDD